MERLFLVLKGSSLVCRDGQRTDTAGKHRLIVNIALNPSHELLNVGRRWHLRWSLVVLRVLPQVLKLIRGLHLGT